MVAVSSSSSCAQAGHPHFHHSFVRPFPPPALASVPLPYILDQLHNLAVNYWDKPHTADCTVIVPIVPQRRPARNSTDCTTNSPLTAAPLRQDGLTGLGRRATEPAAPVMHPTRMTSKLHLDYLLAQSSIFRELFSGRSPSDPACPDSPPAVTRSAMPPHRRPYFMHSMPSHPIIHLPLPDPASFPHLVHFMYFGTFDALESALDSGDVNWTSVVRNVEYLGMRSRIKAFLGRWYSLRMGPAAPPVVCGEDGEGGFLPYGSDIDEEEDSSSDEEDEDDYSDYGSDSDDCMSDGDGSLETLVDDEPLPAFSRKLTFDEAPMTGMDASDDPPRGRSRTRISPRAGTFSPLRRHRS